ncbi:hypothetical protein GW915_08375 [bacterium]|nr:hypothetical protein [bacterium]
MKRLFFVSALLASAVVTAHDEVDCDVYQNEVLDQIERKRDVKAWHYKHVGNVCSIHAVHAFKLVDDGFYYEWELKWASQVNSKQALEALSLVLESKRYYDWELQWASRVDHDGALELFKRIRSKRKFFSWELEWVSSVQSEAAYRSCKRVLGYDTYFKSQLKAACSF